MSDPTRPGPSKNHFPRPWTGRRRPTGPRPVSSLTPRVEFLEGRIVMSTITWDAANHPTGGAWETGTNWVGGVAPGAGDDAVIKLTGANGVVYTNGPDSANSLTTDTKSPIEVRSSSFTLGSGTTAIGAGLTVGSGATLSVANYAKVTINGSVATVASGGSMSFGSSSVTILNSPYGATAQLVVNGTLTATSSTFSSAGNATYLAVNSGGHLVASGSTFATTQVTLDNGSVLNAGDLVGNGFDTTLYLPATYIPLLAANRRFRDVDILAGSLGSGQALTLPALGTDTTANLRYVFAGNFTVGGGASLAAVGGVSLYLNGTVVTVAANAALTLGAGDLVTLNSPYGATAQLVVNGTLTATSSTFSSAGNATYLAVNSGGHLVASGSTFATTQVTLDNGSVLNAGDLVGNGFDTTLYLPATYIPLLAANRRFRDVDILAGSLGSGQALTLPALGTDTTANLRYVFAGNFTVGGGASLAAVGGVSLYLNGTVVTVAANAALTLGAGDLVTLNSPYGATAQLVVNGTLTATSSTFSSAGNATYLAVNSGGQINAKGSILGTTSLALNSGASGSILISSLSTSSTLTIDSNATVTVSGNDFSATGANGVVASGDPNAHINLKSNYWGTTDTIQIAAKIKDHADLATLPTVDFQPFVTGASAVTTSSVSAPYGTAGQTRTLTATVTGAQGAISEGSVMFTVLNGTTVVGSAVSGTVVNNTATATFTLPAGTPAGTYVLQAQYSDSPLNNYLPALDSTHTFTVTQAPVTTALSGNATAPFNAVAGATIPLHATITGGAGVVNEGSVTFTVKSGGTVIGAPVTVNVASGAADANFALPAGTAAGTYSIVATFNGSTNFLASTDGTHTLTITAATPTLGFTDVGATFKVASQTIPLAATVTSIVGTVGSGSITFTLLNGATPVGTPVIATVAAGAANANYTVPAGTPAGTYTLKIAYSGNGNFAAVTDATHTVAISRAATTTTATSTSASAGQVAVLNAQVASGAGVVNEGIVTFKVLDGQTLKGTIVAGYVVNGRVTVGYALPGDLTPGTPYTIAADYSDGGPSTSYLASGASGTTLTINTAPTTVGVNKATATYSPAAQTIALNATVTGAGSVATGGNVTFTIQGVAGTIGTPAVVPVVNGAAGTNFSLPAGTTAGAYTITASYGGTTQFASGTASNSLAIGKATPTIAWATPADIVFGTPLTTAQLDAVASVAGTYNYNKAPGAILGAGAGQALTVNFVPADSADYNAASKPVTINVAKASPAFVQVAPSVAIDHGQATVSVGGILKAPTAIPAGQVVTVSIGSASASAFVQQDGTFAASVDTHALAPGDQTIGYSYAGSANFLAAGDASTHVTVVRVDQAITFNDAPNLVTYGQTFHVRPTSSDGLPVGLAGTNAVITPTGDGGYDVTAASGTNAIVLTASQPGDGSGVGAAQDAVVSVVTLKANATVALAVPSAKEDGQAHPAAASTTPGGLKVILAYAKDGVPVAAPVAAGTYAVFATIDDPNYQGSTSTTLTIAPKDIIVVPPPTPAPVLAQSARLVMNKKQQVTSIVLTFSGDLDAGSAINLANYRLATAGSKGSYDAKNAAKIKIQSATYDPSTHSVTLTVKPFTVSKPVQLRAYGSPGHGVLDAHSRLIDGNRDGVAGGDENAIIRKKAISV